MTEHETDCCGVCAFYGPADAPGAEGTGACWRYPPTPVPMLSPASTPAIATPKGNAPQAAALTVLSIRAPVTPETPACGEFEYVDSEVPTDQQ